MSDGRWIGRRGAQVLAALLLVVALGAGCGREGDDGGEGASAPGVTQDSIAIGGSFPLTGPLAAAGALSHGIEASFGAKNADGGVHGRTIEYTALDDAYDPSRFASNVRRLVQRDGVFALMTGLGPGITVRPFVEQQGVPQLNLSGLSGLSNIAEFPHTRGWWPDSSAEASVVTQHILETEDEPRIGTLMLNNDLGVDMTAGIKRALAGNEDALVEETTFDVTQLDVKSQVNRLRSAGVEQLISSATGASAIQMIRYIDQIGWNPQVFLYSGSTSMKAILEEAGLEASEGLHSALWLKDPADPQWDEDPEMQAYRRQVAEHGAGADPDDLYTANGYVGGQALLAVLETMEDPTREGLLEAIDTFEPRRVPLLAPGIELRAGENGRLIHQYQMVRFDGRSWQPIGDPVDAEAAGFE